MSSIPTYTILCEHCGRPGKVAQSIAKPGTEVKHSATAGGCGMTMRIPG